MSLDTPLTSDEIAYVRGEYESRLYLSACSNTVVYSARLNNPTDLFPTAELSVDGGSGTPSDIEIGMVVLIAHTNNPRAAYFRGRIRNSDGVGYILSGGAGLIYLNQTGNLGFADEDYLFVIRDFAIMEKLPRAAGSLPYPDWNIPFRELLPIISNLRDYADWADTTSGVLTLSFAPNCFAATAGSAIDTGTYLWTIPASGVTITVGSPTTKDITVEIDPASTEYWFKFEVSDDGGRANHFHFKVFSHDADHLPTILAFSDLEIKQDISLNILDGAASGYGGTVKAVKGVDTLLDNTAVLFWVDQFYAGAAVDIGGAGNILLAGRFRSEVNDTGYQSIGGQRKSSIRYEIEGCLNQLSRLRFPPVRINDVTVPVAFNDVRELTLWRGMWLVLSEYSTFAEVQSLVFDDAVDCFYRVPEKNTQGGDLLVTISDLAQSMDATLQDNQAGMCEVARRLPMLSAADRVDVPVIFGLTMQDFGEPDAISLTKPQVKLVGLMKSDGGADHPDEANPAMRLSYYKGRAPDGSPMGASGDGRLPRQVLKTGQSVANEKIELAERTGNALAAMWSPAQITLHLPDNYHGLTPDVAARYPLTLPASETTGGRAYDASTYWWLSSKQLSGDPKSGRLVTHLTFTEETMGTPGVIDTPLAINTGNLPVLGNPYPKIPITPTEDNSNNTNIGDWSPNSGSTIDSSCVAGTAYVDSQYDIGSVVTLNSVTISYTATDSLTGLKNKLSLRVPGSGYAVYASWDTQAGAHSITLNVGGVSAEFIEVFAFGDDDGCVDSISITGISYNAVSSECVRTYTKGNASWPEWANRPDDANYVKQIPGAFVSGTGWTHTDDLYPSAGYNRTAQIVLTHAGMILTKVIIRIVGRRENVAGVLGHGIYPYPLPSSPLWTELWMSDHADFVTYHEWTGSVALDQLIIYDSADHEATLGALIGSVAIEYIELHFDCSGSIPTGGI